MKTIPSVVELLFIANEESVPTLYSLDGTEIHEMASCFCVIGLLCCCFMLAQENSKDVISILNLAFN